MTWEKDVLGIEKCLSESPEVLELEQIYIYESIIDKADGYSMLYGDSESYRAALASFVACRMF